MVQRFRTMSADFLIKKLHAFCELTDADKEALSAFANKSAKVAAGEDVISEGENPKNVYLITKGWGCRYKYLEDGRRQILAFFLPGDLCDLNVYILDQMDHSIGAITPLEFSRVPPEAMNELGDNHPRVMRALWWDTLVTGSIQREWTVSLGQRDALESLAHLYCELYLRMRMVGLCKDGKCNLPLTQQHLADALGLTPTHTGRVIRQLNERGVVQFEKKMLHVKDLQALQEIGYFNANYLHHR
jgi:CRP-like cAMP-binding protein